VIHYRQKKKNKLWEICLPLPEGSIGELVNFKVTRNTESKRTIKLPQNYPVAISEFLQSLDIKVVVVDTIEPVQHKVLRKINTILTYEFMKEWNKPGLKIELGGTMEHNFITKSIQDGITDHTDKYVFYTNHTIKDTFRNHDVTPHDHIKQGGMLEAFALRQKGTPISIFLNQTLYYYTGIFQHLQPNDQVFTTHYTSSAIQQGAEICPYEYKGEFLNQATYKVTKITSLEELTTRTFDLCMDNVLKVRDGSDYFNCAPQHIKTETTVRSKDGQTAFAFSPGTSMPMTTDYFHCNWHIKCVTYKPSFEQPIIPEIEIEQRETKANMKARANIISIATANIDVADYPTIIASVDKMTKNTYSYQQKYDMVHQANEQYLAMKVDYTGRKNWNSLVLAGKHLLIRAQIPVIIGLLFFWMFSLLVPLPTAFSLSVIIAYSLVHFIPEGTPHMSTSNFTTVTLTIVSCITVAHNCLSVEVFKLALSEHSLSDGPPPKYIPPSAITVGFRWMIAIFSLLWIINLQQNFIIQTLRSLITLIRHMMDYIKAVLDKYATIVFIIFYLYTIQFMLYFLSHYSTGNVKVKLVNNVTSNIEY
jgi:hypothetical protein